MYVVFSSNNDITDTGYNAKIHVSEGNCSTPCSDFHPHCGFWESVGYCSSAVAYMSANCRKSCNICHSSSASLKKLGGMKMSSSSKGFSLKEGINEKKPDKQEVIKTSEKASSLRIVKPPFGPEQYQKKVHEKNSDEINVKSEKQMQGILKIPLSQMFKKTNSTSTLYIEPMLCTDYASIGNDICDQANDNLVCQYDGGDCSLGGSATNCTSSECIDNLKFDPCPKFDRIGNDQCDKENFNLICSFDAGDCQAE